MNTMKQYYSIFVCLLLIGCKQTSVNNITGNDFTDTSFVSVKRINITEINESSVTKYSDIYEYIRFVKLETTDNSLIGRIDKIVTSKNKFIILDSSVAKMVFVFDINGNFLNRIGQNGGSNEEYDCPDDIAYDEYNDEVLIWCYNRKKIMRFNTDGHFIDNISVDYWFASLAVENKNTYLLYLNNIPQKDGSINKYNILRINEKGKILSKLLPIDKNASKLTPPAKKVFTVSNSQVLFSQYYNPIVYEIDKDTLRAHYLINFGKHNIPLSLLRNTTSRELTKIIKDNDYAYSLLNLETSSHIVCQFTYKSLIFDCFYSKKSKQTKVSAVYFNDMYALSSNRTFLYQKEDSIISWVNPQSFTMYQNILNISTNKDRFNERLLKQLINPISALIINNRLKNNYSDAIKSSDIYLEKEEIDFINSINEDNNPILIVAKLKEF